MNAAEITQVGIDVRAVELSNLLNKRFLVSERITAARARARARAFRDIAASHALAADITHLEQINARIRVLEADLAQKAA